MTNLTRTITGLAILVMLSLSSVPVHAASIVLDNEEVVSGLSSGIGNERQFRVFVPPNQLLLEVRTWDGSGDCDLFLRHDRRPTEQNYDKRSVWPDTRERVLVKNPQSGWWFVSVRACEPFHGVKLAVQFTGRKPIDNGQWNENLDELLGEDNDDEPHHNFLRRDRHEDNNKRNRPTMMRNDAFQSHTIYPAKDVDWVVLYPPERGRYVLSFAAVTVPLKGEIRSRETGRKEKKIDKFHVSRRGGSIVLNATPHTQYFRIKFQAMDKNNIGSYRVRVRYVPSDAIYDDHDDHFRDDDNGRLDEERRSRRNALLLNGLRLGMTVGGQLLGNNSGNNSNNQGNILRTLNNGQTWRNLRGAPNSRRFFRIFVPNGQTSLRVLTGGGNGDADIFVRRGLLPTLASPNSSQTPATLNSVVIPNPPPGWYYILLYGSSAYRNVEISATFN